METLIQDVRYGLRTLLKNRGFTVVAVVALALGIGANTAIFSVVNAVLLRSLPYKNPERLALIWTSSEKIGLPQNWVSGPELLDFREQSKLFEEFGVIDSDSAALTGSGEPEQLVIGKVSSNFFPVLGVEPAMGRNFLPDEEKPGSDGVVILSHGFWQRRFGGDPAIIGQTIYLDGRPQSVIAVMPRDFALFLPSETHMATNIDVWWPNAVDYAKMHRLSHGLTVIGRLAPGVTREQAQAEMDAIAAGLYDPFYQNTGFGVKVVSLHGDIVRKIRPALLVLLGAVGFVLLIACANVANLFLARAAGREREIAVRTALGAARHRIIRQLLTESVLLSIIGGAFGLLVAAWGMDFLLSLAPANLPRVDEVAIDARVLGFTFSLALLTGVVFGLVPALQVSKPDLNRVLKEGGRSGTGGPGSRRIRDMIVVAEIALSLVLLIGAGLMVRSFLLLRQVDPGFNPQNVLTMNLQLPRSKYPDSPMVGDFYQQLRERIRNLPGVESAATISQLPLSNDYWSGTFTFENVTSGAERGNLASFESDTRIISPDYFKAIGGHLVAGRLFDERDNPTSPRVVIVDDKLAERCWPGADPIGKRVAFGKFPVPPSWMEIIGVVKHIRHHQLDADVREQVYFSHLQRPNRAMTLVVRTSSDPANLAGAVVAAVQSLDADQPVFSIQTMDDLVLRALAPTRFTMLLVGVFAAVAMVLATVGIYGVMSYSVTQRTHEIGIRMALGAQSSDVLKIVIRHGMTLALVGVGIGLGAAFALTRLMSSLLFGVSATDLATFAVISVILTGVALGASYVPARRAMKVDPMVALRYE